MRQFFLKRNQQTVFYLMSSIFLLAVAAALAKSDKINYDDYFFNTTEGDIYKLSLITDASSGYVANCTLGKHIAPFRDIVDEKISVNLCGASRISIFSDNYTLAKEFMKFGVVEIELPQRCIKYNHPSWRIADQPGFFATLSIRFSENSTAFETCLMTMLEAAYAQSEILRSSKVKEDVLIGFIICSSIVCCWPTLYFGSYSCKKTFKSKLKSDAQIYEISNDPLIMDVGSRRYDGTNDKNDDNADEDNGSNDASAARP